jgi:predicted Zn-dependent protease
MATVRAVRESQAAASGGDPAQALADARTAVSLQPGAASAQIQLALVLEQQGRVRHALTAAVAATRDEPDNWSGWLVVSRLEAEAGNPSASLAAYRRSRSLNPRSPLFAQ